MYLNGSLQAYDYSDNYFTVTDSSAVPGTISSTVYNNGYYYPSQCPAGYTCTPN